MQRLSLGMVVVGLASADASASVDAGNGAGASTDAGTIADAGASSNAAADTARFAFDLPSRSALPDQGWVLGSGDFDADGQADLVTVLGDGTVLVALEIGTRGLTTESWRAAASLDLDVAYTFHFDARSADLDQDGVLDLIVSGSGDAPATGCQATVFWGLGDGFFSVGENLTLLTSAADDVIFSCSDLEIGDLDGDTLPEVVLAFNYMPADASNGLIGAFNVVSTLAERDAAGSVFSAPTLYLVQDDLGPYASFGFTLGDLNADGATDLAFGAAIRWLSGPTAWRLQTFHNDGTGAFARATTVDFDCRNCDPTLIRARDYTGDGLPELLLANVHVSFPYPEALPILRFVNTGAGGFAAPEAATLFSGTVGMETVDHTADGQPDLLLVSHDDQLNVLPGTASGSFAPPERFDLGGPIGISVAADFDGDGVLDLAMLAEERPEVRLARGLPSPDHFALPTLSPGTEWIGFMPPPADYDRDGVLDLLNVYAGRVTLMLGTGNGRFTPGFSMPIPFDMPVPVADLDGDGNLDLVVADGNDDFVASLGRADGTFSALPATPVTNNRNVNAATLGDIDGDGDLDLATFQWPRELVDIFINDGAQNFALVRSFSVPRVNHLTLKDFGGDGHLDLFVGSSPSSSGVPEAPFSSSVFTGDGQGNFTLGAAVDIIDFELLVQDVDGDGFEDVLSPRAMVRGDGRGGFGAPTPLPSSPFSRLAVGDLNGDRRLDLVFLDSTGLSAAPGLGGGAFGPAQPLGPARSWQSLLVANVTGNALPDLIGSHLYSSDQVEGAKLVVAENVGALACPPLSPAP